jgi:ParB-like chromosome segregation protein Spo0J
MDVETNTREQTESTVNLPADQLANSLEGKQSESKPQCRNSDIETAKAHPFAKYLPNMDASKFPKIHPHANIFPMMEEDEIQMLVDSIKANGQRNFIRLDHKGRIVDGRNRWVACQRVGVKPRTRQLQRQNNANTLTDIIIENLERRHLTTVQRAVVAELIATAKRGGKNDGKLSLKEAADKVKIDRSTVAAVREIKEKAPDVYAELAEGKYGSGNEATEKSGVRKNKKADAVNREKEPNGQKPTTQEQPTRSDKMPSVKSWNPLEHGFAQVAPHVFQVKGKTKPLSAQKADGNKLEVWTVPPQGKNSVPRVNVTIDGLGQFPGIPLLTYPDPTAGIVSKSATKKADEAWEKENGDDELWQILIKNS